MARKIAIAIFALLAGGLSTSCVQIPPQNVVGESVAGQLSVVGSACQKQPAFRTADSSHGNRMIAKEFDLLTWNIHKQKDEGWREDFSKFAEDAEILALQEAHFDTELGEVLGELDHDWNMAEAWSSAGVSNGVLTSAKAIATHSCALRAMEPLTGLPKSILISRYRISGARESLLVINVHGINFSLGMQEFRRQFEEMEQVVLHHNGPIILAGDFNTWRKARVKTIDEIAERLSLSSIEFHAHNRIRVFGYPLDHVYFRGLEVMRYVSPTVSSSDHNPMLVTFKLMEQEPEKI